MNAQSLEVWRNIVVSVVRCCLINLGGTRSQGLLEDHLKILLCLTKSENAVAVQAEGIDSQEN